MPQFAWVESGLNAVYTAISGAQQRVEETASLNRLARMGAPVDGPDDIDGAVSDFLNRLARISRYTPRAASQIGPWWSQAAAAARYSFGGINLKGWRKIAFPVQVGLSMGTLSVLMVLRMIGMYRVIGLRRMRTLMRDFWVMHTEQPVFLGLQYTDVIDRCKRRLRKAPQDHATRLQLGRLLVKCGRYDDAERELAAIPRGSFRYATGTHERAVALYRGGRFAEAVESEVQALMADPRDQRARMWLWMSAEKLGGYPETVPATFRIAVTAGQAKTEIEFEDIAAKIGLDKTSAGRGTAIFDYDNDGYLDVMVAAAHGGCTLFHNNGDGTFTDVSVGSGLDECVNGFAIAAGDYNNDGFTDVFVTRLGFYWGEGQLFRNNGDGTFTDVTEAAGLKCWGPMFTACWVDYDGDGFLDLFLAHNLGGLFDRKAPNRLFHNNGDGTFTEVAEQAGLKTLWPTIAGTWGDYNNDGRPALFVSNGLGGSQLYRNNGDGTFTDVSEAAGVTKFGFGSPALWWDFDNDGWLDILQFEWSDHEDFVHSMMHDRGPDDGNPVRVYRNNRNGTFTLMNREIGINGGWGTMSGNICDFNNDGYMDIVLGNGGPRMDRMEPMVLMQNDGQRFRNVTSTAGLPFTGKSHGVNAADLFGDGRISILVASGGAYPGDLLTMGAYCPTRLPGNFINVRLNGTKSNRSAIGARLSIEAGGRKQFRIVSGGSNFGCLPLEQHFGLAGTDVVDAIEVRWPSGLVQRFEGPIQANQTLQFTEGQSEYHDVYQKADMTAAVRL
jgi:hypothetical protein